jgi:hypothetical protein
MLEPFHLYIIISFAFKFGAPNGSVYVFHSPASVPTAIRDLAKDPRIFCLQCSAFDDKVKLNDVRQLTCL